ncbi:MAG TPA: ankyrin repeat domain-containing protein [Brachybacterium massiliense]|uniref:Ankyrin repeat domain-containing protein n=1 Tax=Brachybacterium massiliense TaxID=1755098 RepID=A0A921MUX2_9MICO|nr:ankyrin repeat domain-containing protein [Brachybacterium massiliense]
MPGYVDLPDGIEELLRSASREQLEELLSTYELDARDRDEGRTLLSFPDLPDDLVRRLVEQGLEVDTRDATGATPLWSRALEGRTAQIPLLLSLGADVDASNSDGFTPLHAAVASRSVETLRLLLSHGADPFRQAEDSDSTALDFALEECDADEEDLPLLVEVTRTLFEAGLSPTPSMREAVHELGQAFEDHRDEYEAEDLAVVESSMGQLYELFDVPPASARVLHDGISTITVPEGSTLAQFDALWSSLVPPNGPAASAQGEAVRICKAAFATAFDEDDDEEASPGSHFTREHAAMFKALRRILKSGNALSWKERRQAARSAGRILDGEYWDNRITGADGVERDHCEHLAHLAIRWIGQNPDPLPVGQVDYEI